ncbi:MAG: OmpA family protein, partial [Salinibacterium sp.]|nr:OmpA family protein [Salinibacterium sp.]
MSLLLCFFILLAAFSELKQPREYQRVLDAIKEAMGATGNPGTVSLDILTNTSLVNPHTEFRPRSDPEMRRSKQEDDNVKGRNDKVAMVHENERQIIGGALPYEPGQSELTPELERRLANDVAPKIRGLSRRVIIRGHSWGITDSAPGSDPYDLSYHRAAEVRQYLVRECGIDPLMLTIEVVGDGEPLKVPTTDIENAPANRRVEVFLTDVMIDELHPDPNFTGRNR